MFSYVFWLSWSLHLQGAHILVTLVAKLQLSYPPPIAAAVNVHVTVQEFPLLRKISKVESTVDWKVDSEVES
jgi:hypothetical protein